MPGPGDGALLHVHASLFQRRPARRCELHLNQWLLENGQHWASEPEAFLQQDDVSVWSAMRGSGSLHARAVVEREHFQCRSRRREHLSDEEKRRFESLLPELARVRQRQPADLASRPRTLTGCAAAACWCGASTAPWSRWKRPVTSSVI